MKYVSNGYPLPVILMIPCWNPKGRNLLRNILHPRVSTDSGISVGDALEQVKERYPDCVPLDAYPDSGVVYVWEPGGPAYCKHIAFFTQDDVVTGIEIENLMDGRLLD